MTTDRSGFGTRLRQTALAAFGCGLPGQDRWNASYTLSGDPFLADQGFTIFFDPLAYTSLSAPLAPIPSGWSVITVQPDAILSSAGFLDGLALMANPTLAGRPGVQDFQTHDRRGPFQITGTGQTRVAAAAVPEAGTGLAALCLVGFLGGYRQSRGRRAAT